MAFGRARHPPAGPHSVTRAARSSSMARLSCSGLRAAATSTGMHSRKHDHKVEFYAFDILIRSDGEVLRKLTLSMRKVSLTRLLARGASTALGIRARRDRPGL